MNSRQLEVQRYFLDREEEVLKNLESVYTDSLNDVTDKLKSLEFEIDRLKQKYEWADTDKEKEKIKSQIQSKIYQKNYQKALETQLNEILSTMQDRTFTTVSEYLNECYTNGFTGAMYDLHGQNIPFILPIDQEAVVRAVQLDSKINKSLYAKVGENITKLKKDIATSVSMGIAIGMSYEQVAQQLRFKMVGTYNTKGGALARATTIARTEGHRVQIQACMDACYSARKMGADVVKQWDSTLDKRTRESHRVVDGEIRELDEEFSNGLMFPGDPDGRAEEVINCRCALLQRSRMALDESELEMLKRRAEYFGLDKTDSFEDFKKRYLNATNELTKPVDSGIIKTGNILENQRYGRNKNTIVNKAYIDSGEYRRKFDSATDNPKVNKALYNCAKQALKHRSGTAFEDMYWIDDKSGKILLSVTDSTEERAIVYTDKMKNTIKKYKNVITLHTHPSSMPPSISDFNSAFQNGYNGGLVVCHNGKVFSYTSKEEVSEKLYNMYISSFYKEGFSEYESQIKALEKLKQSYDIDFKEMI